MTLNMDVSLAHISPGGRCTLQSGTSTLPEIGAATTTTRAAAAAADSRRDRETTLQRAFTYDSQYLLIELRSTSPRTAATSSCFIRFHGQILPVHRLYQGACDTTESPAGCTKEVDPACRLNYPRGCRSYTLDMRAAPNKERQALLRRVKKMTMV